MLTSSLACHAAFRNLYSCIARYPLTYKLFDEAQCKQFWSEQKVCPYSTPDCDLVFDLGPCYLPAIDYGIAA